MAYATAIALPVASLPIIVLIIPPMLWHLRNHNIGAVSIILWIIIMNTMIFINAILWPDDNFEGRFQGQVLCDIEAKLQIASQVAFPSSFACVLRALAIVMNTDRMVLSRTKSDKRRALAIDILWCFGFPVLQMLLHYIVQPNRYAIFGVSGCQATLSPNLVAVVLILVPPVFWTLVSASYAGLVLARLYHYRQSFQVLLENNNTNKSRFLRLFVLCVIWIIGNVPVQCWIFYLNFSMPHETYEWSDVHRADQWSALYMLASGGRVIYDRYIWLVTGILMFAFFGCGKEATKMYGDGIRALGLSRLVPWKFKSMLKSLHRNNQDKAVSLVNVESRPTWMSCSTVCEDAADVAFVKLSLDEAKLTSAHHTKSMEPGVLESGHA